MFTLTIQACPLHPGVELLYGNMQSPVARFDNHIGLFNQGQKLARADDAPLRWSQRIKAS